MDKGRRNELAKLKQKKRLKDKDTSWMNENQIGQLKNHQIFGSCRCSWCMKKYNRQKNKKANLNED